VLNKSGHRFANTILVIFVLTGAITLISAGNEAWGQSCALNVTKLVRGGDIGFDFTVTVNGNILSNSVLFDGQSTGAALALGDEVVVTEVLPAGWDLRSIQCTSPGLVITELENGVSATCVTQVPDIAECVFINVRPAGIPTLSEWGMMAAAGGLALIGIFYGLRRKRAVA
jgi:hypothetical protein